MSTQNNSNSPQSEPFISFLPSNDEHQAVIQKLIDDGGPLPEQYGIFQDWIDTSTALVAQGRITRHELQSVWHSLGQDFLLDTMQGFALLKPHGYAGDFEMIDRIYSHRVSQNLRFRRWDDFFHKQKAPQAVRNRKACFLNIVQDLLRANGHAPRILNLGSGPCRELAELAASSPTARLEIECVDQDQNAIAFAQSLLSRTGHQFQVRFIESNVLRYRPYGLFDLIWSAGLFDYLPDRLFTTLSARLLHHLAPNGRLVIGNFSACNPTRNYMEIVGEWILNHRTESQLVELAVSAGAMRERVAITNESEGVNLFLVYHA